MHSLPLTELAIVTQLSELAEASKTVAYVADSINDCSCKSVATHLTVQMQPKQYGLLMTSRSQFYF